MLVWLIIASLPLLALAVVTGLRRPIWLLTIYAFTVPWGSGYSLPLGLADSLSSLSTLTGLAASVGIVVHLLGTRRRASILLPSVGLFALLVAVAVATVFWSVDAGRSLDQVITLVSLVALFIVACLLDVGTDDLERLEVGIVAGGAVGGVLAAFQLATGTLATNAAGDPRFALAGGGGETSDPNITAAILMLPFIVAMARGLRASAAGAARTAWLVAAGSIGLAIVLTASRGGLLAAVVAIVILARVHRAGPRMVAALSVVAIVGVLAVGLGPGTLGERLVGEAGSTGRTMIWRIGLVACERHCGVGSGWGTFATVHEDILLREPFATGREFRFEPHNAWLGTAVEGGVAALVLLVAGIGSLARSVRHAPRELRAPAWTALGALVVTNTFLSNHDFKYFWLVLIYTALVATAGRSRHVVRAPAVRDDVSSHTLERVR